jgi:hypothetical protein
MRPTLDMALRTAPRRERTLGAKGFAQVRWARILGLAAILVAWPAILFAVSRIL